MISLEESLGVTTPPTPKPTQTVTPKRKTVQEKTDQLIEHLFHGHKTFTQAAKEIGVSRKTAWTYFTKWKESSEAQLVDTEWWALYLRLKDENPEKALECLTRLKYRMTTEHREVKAEIKQIKLEWKLDSNAANPVQPTPETA